MEELNEKVGLGLAQAFSERAQLWLAKGLDVSTTREVPKQETHLLSLHLSLLPERRRRKSEHCQHL